MRHFYIVLMEISQQSIHAQVQFNFHFRVYCPPIP